jgi:putative transcriptional regulator
MNPINLHRNLHPLARGARQHAVWMAIAVLLALFAQTHAHPPERYAALRVAAVKSRPLPFEAKLAPGTFLVASRDLHNSSFAQTVILLISYDKDGAQGVVINRPSPIQVSSVLPELPNPKLPAPYIFLGGPVAQTQMRILVQTDQPSEEMQQVFDNVYLSGSPDVLKQLMNQPPSASRFRTFAGYAGWAPGQLEREIERGGWHIFHAEVDAIFDPDPRSVWPRLIRERDLKWM